MIRRFRFSVAAAIVILAAGGCQSTSSIPRPHAGDQVSTAAHAHPIEHLDQIAIRLANGEGEFYDLKTGFTFTPRGNNYIRLAPQQDYYGPIRTIHSTFNVGLYDAAHAEDALSQMQALGYNVVRVFLNGCCVGSMYLSPTGPLSNAYMANVADFLSRAKSHDIRTVITSDFAYGQAAHATVDPAYASPNGDFLTAAGITSDILFWSDVISGLHSHGAPFDDLLALELRPELSFNSTVPPFAASQSFTPGVITTGDGNSYDTSNQSQWRPMMDSNLVNWANQVTAQIKALAPHTLVAIGFFAPNDPIAWRDSVRLAYPYPAISSSNIDFVKLSLYPGTISLLAFQTDLSLSGNQLKPAIMGEYGALETMTVQKAADTLVNWQRTSCAELQLKGWLLWTWDTEAAEQTDGPFWAAVDAGGTISNALSPVARPDPCGP